MFGITKQSKKALCERMPSLEKLMKIKMQTNQAKRPKKKPENETDIISQIQESGKSLANL